MPIPTKPSYTHGSTGTSPGNALDYNSGDPVDEEHFDYYLNTEFSKLKGIIDALTEIKNGTITVQSATNADNVQSTYKGNDIDSDGDGVVNEADDTTTVKGNDIDSDGDGTVDSADTAAAVKGNDIDSNGDGKVDAADSADAIKGNDIDSNGDGRVDDADAVRGNAIYVSATEPTGASTGDIWIDTS